MIFSPRKKPNPWTPKKLQNPILVPTLDLELHIFGQDNNIIYLIFRLYLMLKELGKSEQI